MIIMSISIIGFIGIILTTWIILAINKYQYLKKAHEDYVVGFAKTFNSIENDNIKRAIVDNAKTRGLLLEGLLANDMELLRTQRAGTSPNTSVST